MKTYEKLVFHDITECSHFFAVSSKTIYVLANGNAYSVTNTVYYFPHNENLDFCDVVKMAYGRDKKTVYKTCTINR